MGICLIGFVFFSAVAGAIGLCLVSRSPGAPVDFDPDLAGIRGWLILVLIGMFYRVYAYGKTALTCVTACFSETKWNLLTQPGSYAYDPHWEAALLYEACASSALLVASLLAFVLMFLKKFTYPYVMIGLIGGGLVFHVVDHMLCRSIAAVHTTDAEAGVATLKLVMVALIWIPYFLISKRVKATFTR